MMMCNDLICTEKLTGSQLSLAQTATVKTHMPEKNEKRVRGVSPVGGKVELLRKECLES